MCAFIMELLCGAAKNYFLKKFWANPSINIYIKRKSFHGMPKYKRENQYFPPKRNLCFPKKLILGP
jgi:hypothetical protein